MKALWVLRLSPKVRAWVMRVGFNLHPAFRGSGGKMTYVSPDFRQMRAKLAFGWRTKNIVGSIYGGSLFAVTDGPHPIMLMAALGPDCVVWDKTATIRYRKPAFTDLTVDFNLSESDLRQIQDKLGVLHECEHNFTMELKDASGESHATIVRTIYIATKSFYRHKLSKTPVKRQGTVDGENLA